MCVLYCCVTNYPKMQCLQSTALYYVSVCCRPGSAGCSYAGLTKGFASSCSHVVAGLHSTKDRTCYGSLLCRAAPGLCLSMWHLNVVFLYMVSPAEELDFLHRGSGLPRMNMSRSKKQELPFSLNAGPAANAAFYSLRAVV